jgi:hypothetical protein
MVTGQHRANQALGVLNLWVENGAVAPPAYLVRAAADRYPALRALLHRSAVG